MTENNPRKDPFRIRRSSTKEFSRVTTMIRSILDDHEERLEALEKKKSRIRTKKPKEKKEEE